uniref:RNA polymerase II transcription factor B subunit 4 n=1 Tax=Pseudo-nitzschia australis TaxID=44445 RepID=A0A7S4ATL5_9STRA|mmetsp:Transcript_17897/g.39050  ORF Transcript_17897/g.39050 Transcript_17897/m.39050 type:complete len:368 (-) Transcript_17897:79-1182(-)|eukprot:CAMPEP_0168195568 /NCGR_PEP_ID=MMETSP0139_2-20121125/19924_1 /TAXON_ID=44445 /ORGANISM="Pseudo-nitzschia australis, Strain 10249 10 AB" /LENGTH=367 /DNA_ID=CAMNT_0008119429 /DNA_START=261 /DNA_END=1364 /DNA_ORIENTATION=+
MKRLGERSLTVLVVDVSPVTWGKREMLRTAQDKAREANNKESIGPATLDDLLSAVQAFSSAYSSLERDSALIIVGVAGSEVAVVHPRKNDMEEYFANPESKLDSRKIQSDLLEGVAELVSRAVAKQSSNPNHNTESQPTPLTASLAAMASGFSISLCLINRFLVAINSGVSALRDHDSWSRQNGNDEGVITALSGNGGGSGGKSNKGRAWSPRILLIQASDDRPSDYNAFMNCVFASVKQNVVVDGCFIVESSQSNQTSPYLEQTCDLTGGLLSNPKGASQSNKALTEILLSVFLPTRSSRPRLNLPGIDVVDFRPRSFDTRAMLDIAFVCNQCLSIFEKKPEGRCPTCDAEIRLPGSSKNKKKRMG